MSYKAMIGMPFAIYPLRNRRYAPNGTGTFSTRTEAGDCGLPGIPLAARKKEASPCRRRKADWLLIQAAG